MGQRAKILKKVLPCSDWLPQYNASWLYGDVIAGITVGILIIPQAIAYAKLASLPVQYGLYTAFTGLLLYFPFSTSKDVTIGPTAVLSQLTAQVIVTYNTGEYAVNPALFVAAVACFTGIIQVVVGLLQLGVIVDLVPLGVVYGFTTGAAISIICGQIPGLLGITGINTNDPAYLVFGNTMSQLASTKLDAAFGLSALFVLLLVKYSTMYFEKKHKWTIWVSYATPFLVIMILTVISFLLQRNNSKTIVRIVGDVPKGLHGVGVPSFAGFSNIAQASITVFIVATLEHIAIAKSFGSLNGYSPNSSQEIFAAGLINIIGSFLGAFPATGSFSRSALKANSGVKSPIADLFSALILILVLFFLTPAVYYIPSSVLSAVIVQSILSIIVPFEIVMRLYNTSLIDLASLVVALVFTIFFSMEIGIYVATLFAILALLYRVARPTYTIIVHDKEKGKWLDHKATKEKQPSLAVASESQGVFVVKIDESVCFPNAKYLHEQIRDWVMAHVQIGISERLNAKRLWCDNTHRYSQADISTPTETASPLVPLKAIIFDFSGVHLVDVTGLSSLIDLKRDIERFVGRFVPFVFVHVHPDNLQLVRYIHGVLSRSASEYEAIYDDADDALNGVLSSMIQSDEDTKFEEVIHEL